MSASPFFTSKRAFLDRKPFGQVRVVPQHAVRVADVEERRDELDLEVGGDLLGPLEVLEVPLVHVAELGHLGVGHEDLGVAGLGGAGPELLRRVDVLVHQEVDLVVEVELGLGGAVLGAGGNREQRHEQPGQTEVSHARPHDALHPTIPALRSIKAGGGPFVAR
jgi:hypothetical protein